jgi:hypothetical protein
MLFFALPTEKKNKTNMNGQQCRVVAAAAATIGK